MALFFLLNFVVQHLFGWDLTAIFGIERDEEGEEQQALLEKHQSEKGAVETEWPNDLGVSISGHARLR